jgi:integrase
MTSIHPLAGNGSTRAAISEAVSQDAVLQRIARYTPDIPPQYWDVVAPFVRSVASDVQLATDRPVSKPLLWILTRLALWAWQTAGLELDRTTLLTPEVIAEFIETGCPSLRTSTCGTIRSNLLYARKVLLAKESSTRFEPQRFTASDPMRPYSTKDLVALRTWASGQHSDIRRRDCWTLLALGAGAGLASEDIVRLKTDDVNVDSLGVLLKVTGRRARLVPVLSDWEQPIIDATSAIGPGLPLFGAQRTSFNNNAISALVSRSSGAGIKPSLQRLRATWMIHHLSVGIPVIHLMKAAGIETLDALDRYLQYIPEPEAHKFRTTLRGPSPKDDNS